MVSLDIGVRDSGSLGSQIDLFTVSDRDGILFEGAGGGGWGWGVKQLAITCSYSELFFN